MVYICPMPVVERQTGKYLARYYHDGTWWAAEIYAYDYEDAETRCKRLNMQLDGKYVATVRYKWLAKLICWLRNLTHNGDKTC